MALVRNGAAVLADWDIQEDKSVVTRGGCSILTPVRYEGLGLSIIGSENRVCACCPIILPDGQYGVSHALTQLHIDPSDIREVTMDGQPFYEFVFLPGDTVLVSTDVVMRNSFPWLMYNEIYTLGKVPWWYTEKEKYQLLYTSAKLAGVKLNADSSIYSVLASITTRDPNDRRRAWRLLSDEERSTLKAIDIGLRNIIDSGTNTITNLMGGYVNNAIDSSLVYPADTISETEAILRG